MSFVWRKTRRKQFVLPHSLSLKKSRHSFPTREPRPKVHIDVDFKPPPRLDEKSKWLKNQKILPSNYGWVLGGIRFWTGQNVIVQAGHFEVWLSGQITYWILILWVCNAIDASIAKPNAYKINFQFLRI